MGCVIDYGVVRELNVRLYTFCLPLDDFNRQMSAGVADISEHGALTVDLNPRAVAAVRASTIPCMLLDRLQQLVDMTVEERRTFVKLYLSDPSVEWWTLLDVARALCA